MLSWGSTGLWHRGSSNLVGERQQLLQDRVGYLMRRQQRPYLNREGGAGQGRGRESKEALRAVLGLTSTDKTSRVRWDWEGQECKLVSEWGWGGANKEERGTWRRSWTWGMKTLLNWGRPGVPAPRQKRRLAPWFFKGQKQAGKGSLCGVLLHPTKRKLRHAHAIMSGLCCLWKSIMMPTGGRGTGSQDCLQAWHTDSSIS